MITQKIYIANKGYTGKTVHAVRVYEDENGKINMHIDDNLCYNWETTIRPIVNLKKVEATTENVTCKNCIKALERRKAVV